MSDSIDWKQRYQNWVKEMGFEGEPSGLEVFQNLMESRARHNRDLIDKMQGHFEQIDVILKETPSERPNE
ncbi:MAG: hypothetical protein KC553_04605 [Nitrospina sp.]|nr:hypothetical protein [Nitrospina sp.]